MIPRTLIIDGALALALAVVLLASLGLGIVAIVAGCALVVCAIGSMVELLVRRRRRGRGARRA